MNRHSNAWYLKTGALGKCPRCGQGHLFCQLINIVKVCPSCQLNLEAHDAGDGPAVAGTFFVGALALAVALIMEFRYEPPLWVFIAVLFPLIVIGTIVSIRIVKGILVALQYRHRSLNQDDQNLGQM